MGFGYYETVYFALSMDFSNPRIAATMFAVFMAIGNLGIAVGQSLAGVLVDNVGFRWTFVILALINLAVLPMIPAIFRKGKTILMKIASVHVDDLDLVPVVPLVVSYGTFETLDYVLLTLTTDDGTIGYGEGAVDFDVTGETRQDVKTALSAISGGPPRAETPLTSRR